MSDASTQGARQGSTDPWRERLPLPDAAAMTAAQKAAADALIAGPRKGVYGPFLPLMQSPALLDRVASAAETARAVAAGLQGLWVNNPIQANDVTGAYWSE